MIQPIKACRMSIIIVTIHLLLSQQHAYILPSASLSPLLTSCSSTNSTQSVATSLEDRRIQLCNLVITSV